MVRVEMGEHEIIDAIDPGPVQLKSNLRRGVYKKMFVVQKGGRACPFIGTATGSRLPANPALAERLGDNHAPP